MSEYSLTKRGCSVSRLSLYPLTKPLVSVEICSSSMCTPLDATTCKLSSSTSSWSITCACLSLHSYFLFRSINRPLASSLRSNSAYSSSCCALSAAIELSFSAFRSPRRLIFLSRLMMRLYSSSSLLIMFELSSSTASGFGNDSAIAPLSFVFSLLLEELKAEPLFGSELLYEFFID